MTISCFFHLLKHRLWSTSTVLLLIHPAGKLADGSVRTPCPGEFRMVTEENINDCAAFEDASHYVPVYREMLKQGDVVRFGYMDGSCVFRHCMQMSGPFREDGCVARCLGPDEAYIQYVFCAPPARGLGFHTEGTRQLCKLFPNRTIYTTVKADNKSSLHGFFKSGFEVHSLLTVKNRFLRRTLTEKRLTPQEASRYYC